MGDDGSYEALLRDFAVRKRKAAANDGEAGDASAAAAGPARSRGRTAAPEKSELPPASYVCHKCNGSGHYIVKCPMWKRARHDGHVDDRRGTPPRYDDRGPARYDDRAPTAPPRYDDRRPPQLPRYDNRRPQPRHGDHNAPRPGARGSPAPRGHGGGCNRAKLNALISGEARARELLDLHTQHGSSFNNVNISTIWSRLGRVTPAELGWLRSDDGARLLALREQTSRQVLSLEPRGRVTVAHALAKLAFPSPAWDCLWKRLEGAVLACTSKFNTQDMANSVWAFAAAGHAAPALFDAIAVEAAGRVSEFKPQELANTTWALATANHAAPALFDPFVAEAVGKVSEFNPQNLANTAWAFAKSGHTAPALLDAIAVESSGRVSDFKPQELANTAWAFAKAGHTASALLEAIAVESAGRVSDFDPCQLANTAWAFAKAGHTAPALLDAIAVESAGRVRDFKPQELANTAWAFATAGHTAPAIFDAIAVESAGRVSNFKPQELANTAWAFAKAGHAAPAIFDSIAMEAANRLDEFDLQNLANIAWAFAVADCLPVESSLFDRRFAIRCDALAHEFSIEELHQLHQWRLWYAGERGCSDGLPGTPLLARCATSFRASEVTISRLQSQVVEVLVSLGATVQQEVVLEEGYSLDSVVEWGSERLALEVDGPFHFVGREPTGATLLKRRQLKHFGWRLVSVPYWEWDERTHRQRAAYLTTLLSPVGENTA